MDIFKEYQLIGRGNFGEIYQVKHDSQEVELKLIELSKKKKKISRV